MAHATLSRLLSEARFLRPIPLPEPTALGYCFQKDQGEVWVLWNHEKASPVSLPVDSQSVTLIDLMGGEKPAPVENGRLTLSLRGEPVFVRIGR